MAINKIGEWKWTKKWKVTSPRAASTKQWANWLAFHTSYSDFPIVSFLLFFCAFEQTSCFGVWDLWVGGLGL